MQIQLLSRQKQQIAKRHGRPLLQHLHTGAIGSLSDHLRGCWTVSRYRGCFTASRERSGRQAYPIGDRAGPTGGPQLRSRSRAGLSSPLCWHARTPLPPHRTGCRSARATPQMEGQHKTPSRHRLSPSRPPNFRRAAFPHHLGCRLLDGAAHPVAVFQDGRRAPVSRGRQGPLLGFLIVREALQRLAVLGAPPPEMIAVVSPDCFVPAVEGHEQRVSRGPDLQDMFRSRMPSWAWRGSQATILQTTA